MTGAATYHHVTLSVTDLSRSVAWYSRVLQAAVVGERSGATWRRTLLRTTGGLVLALTQHDRTPSDDCFDERRVGLDHLAIACADASEVEAWSQHLDAVGEPHSEITRAPHATLVTCRDPDRIQIEFYAPR